MVIYREWTTLVKSNIVIKYNRLYDNIIITLLNL